MLDLCFYAPIMLKIMISGSPLSNKIKRQNIMNHVCHSWDEEVVYKITEPKNQPQFSQTTIGQVKLSPNKLSN